MSVIVVMAGATFLLALAMTLTGWAVAVLAGIGRLRSARLEAIGANAFIGTSACILLWGGASYLGFSARQSCWPLAAAAGGMVAAATAVARPVFLRGLRLSLPLLGLAAAVLLAVWFVLQPVRGCHCACPYNDTLIYLSVGKWLQEHGFGLHAVELDLEHPVVKAVWIHQVNGLRMGSTFLLAELQALSNYDGVLVYPVVMTWGMLLNLAGIYLLMRWTFRLPRWAASGTVLMASTACNPLYGSILMGFQPQVYGTAYLSFCLALLSRCSRSTFWSGPNAILLALGISGFLRVYSDLAPVLAVAGFGCVGLTAVYAYRKERLAQFARFSRAAVLWLAVLGNVEWPRAWMAVQSQLGAVVGWEIPWSAWDFAAFALGMRPIQQYPCLGPALMALTVAAFALFLVGLARVIRNRRAAPLVLALATYGGLAIFYGAFGNQEVSEALGRRWPLFKICKWAFPLVLAVQFAGLALLLQRFSKRRWAIWLPGLLILFAAVPQQRAWVKHYQTVLLKYTGTADPADSWSETRRRLDRDGIEQVVLLNPEQDQPTRLAPYIFHPLPTLSMPIDPERLGPRTALILWGAETLDVHGERLPGNFLLVDQSRPQLFAVGGVNPRRRSGEKPGLTLDHTPSGCFLWSPRSGCVRLRATVQSPGPSQLTILFETGRQRSVSVAPDEPIEIVLDVPAGRSRLELSTSDGPLRLEAPSVELIEPRTDSRGTNGPSGAD